MDNDLDDMLYAAHLAKLESLKGTKKPLVDFIQEMANNTNNFYYLTYRQFQLVTIAINNCTAKHIINERQKYDLQQRLTILIRNHGTEENILELLEFYTSTVYFRPYNREQFILMDKLYNIVKANKPELEIYFEHNSVRLFTEFPFLKYVILHKYNPDSLLLKKYTKVSKENLIEFKKYSKEIMELLEHGEYILNKESTCNS